MCLQKPEGITECIVKTLFEYDIYTYWHLLHDPGVSTTQWKKIINYYIVVFETSTLLPSVTSLQLHLPSDKSPFAFRRAFIVSQSHPLPFPRSPWNIRSGLLFCNNTEMNDVLAITKNFLPWPRQLGRAVRNSDPERERGRKSLEAFIWTTFKE